MSAAAPEVLQCIVARYNYAVDLQRACSMQRAACSVQQHVTHNEHNAQDATCNMLRAMSRRISHEALSNHASVVAKLGASI